MFTGLVRGAGEVKGVQAFGKGRKFAIDISSLAIPVEVGQSIAVNGVCLTVTTLSGGVATFDAVTETVNRSNLGKLGAGDRVNLEPALRAGDMLDGHIVLGHVDAVGTVLAVDERNPDNRTVRIQLPAAIRHLVAEKGSIAVDGISLTVAAAGSDEFTIAVIPHTWKNSTLFCRKPGDPVNLEVDVLARYVARIAEYGGGKGLTEDFLRQHGFA